MPEPIATQDKKSERRPCPLCGSSETIFERELPDHQSVEMFRLERCSECGGKFINPPPSTAEIGRYYEGFGGQMMHGEENAIFARLRSFAIAREMAPLLRRLPSQAVIADVGAGDGQVAAFLARKGYTALAMDTFPESGWIHPTVSYRQIDINSPDPALFSSVDAVVMRHVLEHVHTPSALLRTYAEAGVQFLFLLVPNASTRCARLFGQWWYYWDPPRHLTSFTGETLVATARRCGYRQVAAGDHGIDEIVTSLYRRGMAGWSRNPDPAPNQGAPFWYHFLKPKGVPAALSSMISAPLASSVLCRVFQLESK